MRNPFHTYITIIPLTLHVLELMHCQLGFLPVLLFCRSQRVFPMTFHICPGGISLLSFAFSSRFLPGNPEKSSESHLKSGLRNILSKYSEAHTLLQLQDTVCAEGWI